MAENFEELYNQLSNQESFPFYFKTKDDFQKFLLENEEADTVVENLFGVKAASEYLKKKDQPIIQNLTKENSSFQFPLGGQTDQVPQQTQEMVEQPEMGSDQNIGVVEDPLNLMPPVLPAIGYGKSFEAAPGPQIKKKPSDILVSKGNYAWNDRGTGSNIHKNYTDLYREISRVSNDPNASLTNLQSKINQFVDVYRQLKPTENVVEDFNTLLKIVEQQQPKLSFEVDENGVRIKPKTSQAPKLNFPGTQQGPFIPKEPEVPESDAAIEGYIAFYKDRGGIIDTRSSETQLTQEVGLGKAENSIDGFLVKEANRLFTNIGGNINKFTFDQPGVVGGEINPNRKTLYDGLYFVNDRGNIAIDEVFINDQVKRSLSSPVGLLNPKLLEKLEQRFDMSKEEIVDVLTPRLTRLVKAQAEQNLTTIQVESKLEKIAPEIKTELEEVNRQVVSDLDKLTKQSKEKQSLFAKELKIRTASQISELETTAKSDIEFKYNEYKSIVARGAITEEQNVNLYNQFLEFVNQRTTELNNAEASIYSNTKQEAQNYALRLETEAQKQVEQINKKYGIQEENGKKTTAAYRKLKGAYDRAYAEVQYDARRNSDELGWGLVDLIQSSGEGVAARSIDALSAAVGYENNPFTDILAVLNTLEQQSAVPMEQFSKVLERDGFLSMNTLKATVQQIVQQTVNFVPTVAATYLTGNPWVGGAVGWAQDSVRQVGEIYKNTFEKTGSVEAAEEAAANALKTQILLYPTYALQMIPFAKGFLTKITQGTGVSGYFKKAAVGIAIEEGTETIQELPQGYQTYLSTTDDAEPKSFLQYVSENAFNTAVDVAPATFVLGGLGAGIENYSETKLEKSKTEILSRLEDIGMSQVVADMLQVVGPNGIGIIPEYLYRNGVISDTEFLQMKSVFSEVAKTFPQIKEVILDKDTQKFFVSQTIKKKKLETILEKTDNPNVKITIESQIKAIDKTLGSLASNEKVPFSKVTFSDGTSIVLSDIELAQKIVDRKFMDALANESVTVETSNAKLQEALDKSKEKIAKEVVKGPQELVNLKSRITDRGTTVDNEQAFQEKLNKAVERGQQNGDLISQQAKKLQNLLNTIAPGSKIIFMNQEEYEDAMPLVEGDVNSRGNFTFLEGENGTRGVEVHINLDKALSNTLEHEVSHALIFKTLGNDPELFGKMVTALENASNKALGAEANNLKALVKEYAGSDQSLEFLAEASSLLARDAQRMSLSTIENIAKVISEFVAYISGGKVQLFESIKTKEGFVNYMNALADTLSSGQFSEVLNQPIQNAVQEQTTSQVSVQPEATTSQEVEQGKSQTEPQGVTQEGKDQEVTTPTEKQPTRKKNKIVEPVELSPEVNSYLDGDENPLGTFFASRSQIDFEETSGSTQVATTIGSYKKVADLIKKADLKGDVLDYGAGLGLGSDAMSKILGRDIETLEGNNEKWRSKKPTTYKSSVDINKKFDSIVSLNVLNVVEKATRDAIVFDIFDKLNDNGKAFISTRGWEGDVKNTKNGTPGLEKNSFYVNKKSGLTYQKGFDSDELVDYVQDILGPNAIVQKNNNFGKVGVVITKLPEEQVQITSKSQKIFTDEKGNPRNVKNLGKLAEDTIPIQANEQSIGSLGKAAVNEIFRIYQGLGVDPYTVSSVDYGKNPQETVKDPNDRNKKLDAPLIEKWARDNKVYVANFMNLFSPERQLAKDRTMESIIFISEGSKYVYKAAQPTYGHSYLGLIRKTMAHNILFPETAYEIVGFTKVKGDPTLRVILKQPAFKLDEVVLMDRLEDRVNIITDRVLEAPKYGPVGVMNDERREAIDDLIEESEAVFNDVVETLKAKGLTPKFEKQGAYLVGVDEEKGIRVDDLHSGAMDDIIMADPMRLPQNADSSANIFLDDEQNLLFIDPYIDLTKTGPGSWLDENINPLFDGFIGKATSKSQLDFTQIKPEFDAALALPFGTPTGAFQVLIQKGYTPKRIKEALGAYDFDRYQSSFKQAQAIVATKTMNDVGTLFEGRQEQIKAEINNNIGNVEAIYDQLIASPNNFSPLEIFTAVRDMDFMTTGEMIDLFGAEYRQTVQSALEQENYPTDFLGELDADAKNLKVEQNAGDIANLLREVGLGVVDSAITMDVFLDYLKQNGFEQIAIQMITAVKDFAKNKNADWTQIMASGALTDSLYTQEGINYAFQVSSELFSQAGRILQMARFFNEVGTQMVIEKQMDLESIILTPKQKEILTNLVNDYKTSQTQNKRLLETLQEDWSDEAFNAYFDSEKQVGLSTIRLAQFIDARKPGFYNERITSGGSRGLLGISTAVLSFVANVENNLLSTNFVSKSIQKLRDYVGTGIKGTTLSFNNWRMARDLSKARSKFDVTTNAKYGVINKAQIERYYDNLGQVDFFKDPQWVYKFMDVWARKSTGKSLSEMTLEEQTDALDMTLIKLKDGTLEMRDGKGYTLARSMAWTLSLGPLGSELTGRAMSYGGDIMFGYMAAQRSMIDYFKNIEGTRFQDGMFDSMMKDANGNLDANALRALSTLLMSDSELYAKFEQEGLRRTLLADNIFSSFISKGRGKIRKNIRQTYVANRLGNPGQGFGAEAKRQFTMLGIKKNAMQVSDIALWTLMPFTKVPVNFLGSALIKTMPMLAAPKYMYSEGAYQLKWKKFKTDYPIGKKLNSVKAKRDYELAKIDLFSAKRQATYDAAQMVTSFAIYSFAISAVKSGAIMIKEEPEKEDALRPAQLRSGLYNATLHREYMLQNGKNLINTAGKTFGLDVLSYSGTDNFISRRGGFAKEGDMIMNTNNFGYLGYAMNLYGSVYTNERKDQNDLMVQMLDDQANGFMTLVNTALSTGIETLPMFQGVARVGSLLNDYKNPDTQKQAWNNFVSGTLSTSMAVFFPSLTSFVSKGNAELIQSTKEVFPERENGNWTQWMGNVSVNVVQKLNRNVSFSPGTRNEFYESQIGPFGEDLSYKVTYADPGTIGAYLQAIMDPFAFRKYTSVGKFNKADENEVLKYKEAAVLNSGLINLATMFQQMTGRDYEWKWDGKNAGMYQIITNPKKNKFVWKQDISTGGFDAPNTPNYLEYTLPNDLYRKELKERGESMRLSLRQYGTIIQETIIPQVQSYVDAGQLDMAQKTIVDFFKLYESALAGANEAYDQQYANRQKGYIVEMQKRGLITEQMMTKMINMGLADSSGLIR
jgi:hypothetical protein